MISTLNVVVRNSYLAKVFSEFSRGASKLVVVDAPQPGGVDHLRHETALVSQLCLSAQETEGSGVYVDQDLRLPRYRLVFASALNMNTFTRLGSFTNPMGYSVTAPPLHSVSMVCDADGIMHLVERGQSQIIAANEIITPSGDYPGQDEVT